MIELKRSVRNLKPYFVNQVPYRVKMDANETKNYLLSQEPLLEKIEANIYPDSDATILRQKLAGYYGCKPNNIMVGNGSSDMINLVINGFCETDDSVLSFTPSFSMYENYCVMAGAKLVKLECNADFSVDITSLVDKAKEIKPKIVIICNPNNPTGYYIEKRDVIEAIEELKDSIIILDEAYIDFGGESCVDLINQYDNLIAMRTLSKAFGLAALRVGCMIANEAMINRIWAIKFPYNLNALSQYYGAMALDRAYEVAGFVEEIATQRERLSEKLKSLNFEVYPSKANFLFVKHNRQDLFELLSERGILIRKMPINSITYYRISVGSEKENKILIKELEEIL
ncbi:MAG: Histidinol-phosphate aminotransferase [Clostridiales bacterium 38_11]|nr:MAG: Histidinol-phosphate aminotransferase [Clostridiales bacterium 38_11]HBH12374.1 histidinol-phosphate transaminase [Clostridiales bacterium]